MKQRRQKVESKKILTKSISKISEDPCCPEHHNYTAPTCRHLPCCHKINMIVMINAVFTNDELCNERSLIPKSSPAWKRLSIAAAFLNSIMICIHSLLWEQCASVGYIHKCSAFYLYYTWFSFDPLRNKNRISFLSRLECSFFWKWIMM